MLKVVIFFAILVLFFGIECNIIKREDDDCAHLRTCKMPVNLLQHFYTEGAYDTFCQAKAPFISCGEKYKPECTDESTRLDYETLEEFAKYICSSEGSAAIYAAAQSECVTDATKKSEIVSGLNHCVSLAFNGWEEAVITAKTNGVQWEEKQFCPFFELGLNCVTDLITEKCGYDLVPFLRELAVRLARTRLGCNFASRTVRSLFGNIAIPPF